MAAKKAIYSILDLKGNVISNVGAPSLDTDVATKASAGADATTKANAAKEAAEATAATLASDAQAAAVTSANGYTDTKIAALIGEDTPAALDTLKEISEALADQDDAVAALVVTIGTVSTDLATETTNRQNADTALSGRLDTAESDIDTLQSNVGTLQTNLGTAQSDIGTLQTNLSTAQTNIGTLQTGLGTAESDIDTLQSNVGTLQTGLGTAQTNIGTLQTNVSTAQSDIGTLQSDVSSINTSLASKLQIATDTATGSGTSTAEGYEYTIDHNLNQANVIAQVYDGNDVVDVVIRKVNNNSLKLITGSALGATTLTVVVAG